MNVKLFLIFYEEDKRVKVEQIGLNDKRLINIEDNISAMRLAIRVDGKEFLKLKT